MEKSMAEPIVLKNLCKTYSMPGEEIHAVRDITLTIPDREFIAIMGRSGCGKSTLLQILGTLLAPTSGSYLLRGQEVAGMNEKQVSALRRREIGRCAWIVQSRTKTISWTWPEAAESRIRWANIRISSLAVSSSESLSFARWQPSPASCWRMNPPATWTTRQERRLCTSCRYAAPASIRRLLWEHMIGRPHPAPIRSGGWKTARSSRKTSRKSGRRQGMSGMKCRKSWPNKNGILV